MSENSKNNSTNNFRNKASLIKNLIKSQFSAFDIFDLEEDVEQKTISNSETNEIYDDIMNFAFYLSTQKKHQYNYSYYIEQKKSFEKDVDNLRSKYCDICNIFDEFEKSPLKQDKLKITIDNLFIIQNKRSEKESENEENKQIDKKEYLKEGNSYLLFIDKKLATLFDLKSQINTKHYTIQIQNTNDDHQELNLTITIQRYNTEQKKDNSEAQKIYKQIIAIINND